MKSLKKEDRKNSQIKRVYNVLVYFIDTE